MTRKMLGRYIVADTEICHGRPTFRGTRIMASQVLEMLADGMAWETITEEWGGKVTNEAIAEAKHLAKQIIDETLLRDLVSVLREKDPMSFDDDHRRKEAEVVLRRWRSFNRRTRIKRPTFEHRVEDIAKGIRDAIEPDRHLVGPLMEDYRYTAQVLAEAIQEAETKYRMP